MAPTRVRLMPWEIGRRGLCRQDHPHHRRGQDQSAERPHDHGFRQQAAQGLQRPLRFGD